MRLEDDVILVEFRDEVSRHDLLTAMVEVGRIETTLDFAPARLIDLTRVASCNIRYPEVSDHADSRQKRTYPNRYRSAIVAREPVAYGLARMFESLHDSPFVEMRIFAERSAAESWLAAPRAPQGR